MKVLLLIIQEFKITNDTIMFIVKKKQLMCMMIDD